MIGVDVVAAACSGVPVARLRPRLPVRADAAAATRLLPRVPREDQERRHVAAVPQRAHRLPAGPREPQRHPAAARQAAVRLVLL